MKQVPAIYSTQNHHIVSQSIKGHCSTVFPHVTTTQTWRFSSRNLLARIQLQQIPKFMLEEYLHPHNFVDYNFGHSPL